jgi:type IV pilus assembly protein PilQ
MKTKLAIMFAAGLQALALAAFAQTAKPAAAEEAGQLIVIDDTDLNDVIRSLARQANLNILFDPALTPPPPAPGAAAPAQPKVTIRMENVTPQQALEAILANYGMEMVLDPKTKVARVTKKDPNRLEPLTSSIFQLRHASPSNVVAMVQTTIGTRGKVIADTRTGQLLVVATEKELGTVTNLLERFDIPTKQILIEGRIMETSKNPRSFKGLDWAGTLEAQNFAFGNGFTTGSSTASAPGATTTTTATTPSGATVTTVSAATATRSTTLTTDIGNGGLSIATAKGLTPGLAFLSADGVRGVLSFLNTDADTEVVSTPRAVTMDNQTAMLEVSKIFPTFKITPGSANSPAGAEITYTNVGTSLEVTPRITGTNVALKVSPKVSNVDSVDRQTVAGFVNTANVYAVRKIDTQVLIPSGFTLVMGGLINDTTTKGFTKIPLLGDLPGIGLAFRRESKTRIKQNLLIFITPTIITDEDFSMVKSDFLKNKPLDKPDFDETAWDSGKPKEWGKKGY